jgi:hypothetical protein
MKREIASSGGLKGSRCCPGHDKWPSDTYHSRRSVKARARSKQLEHQSARTRAKASTRKETY